MAVIIDAGIDVIIDRITDRITDAEVIVGVVGFRVDGDVIVFCVGSEDVPSFHCPMH